MGSLSKTLVNADYSVPSTRLEQDWVDMPLAILKHEVSRKRLNKAC